VKDWQECSDSELLVAARTDAEAFGVFYERHFATVLAFFRRRVPGVEEAFDLVAETFAAALGSVSRYQPGPEPAQAWLFAIGRHKLSEAIRTNQIQDEARRALGMQPIQLDDEAVEILEKVAIGPALELLEALPDGQREAIEAHHLDERSYPEIAAQFRCSESVVRKRVSRGLSVLRASFARGEADE
jgi:RNA polymerase sigma-70 factor (ECF subfamily)